MHVAQNFHKQNTATFLKKHRKKAPVLFKSKLISHKYWVLQVHELLTEGFYKTNSANTT